jgi:hypothetical protein
MEGLGVISKLITKRSFKRQQKEKIVMMNPGAMMKIMSAKNKFTENHPKFVAFLNMIFNRGITEGTIIEITVTRPGEQPVTSNMKVLESDLELMDELKSLAK